MRLIRSNDSSVVDGRTHSDRVVSAHLPARFLALRRVPANCGPIAAARHGMLSRNESPPSLVLSREGEHQAVALARTSARPSLDGKALSCHWSRFSVLIAVAVCFPVCFVVGARTQFVPPWLRARGGLVTSAQTRFTELRLARNASAIGAIEVASRAVNRSVGLSESAVVGSLGVAALVLMLSLASPSAITRTLRSR